MNKKEKLSVVEIVERIVILMPGVFIILAVGLGCLRLSLRTESAVTVTAECQVVDKFVNSHFRARDSYYITLLFSEADKEFEKDVQITVESFANDVNIGDSLPCTVMYDEKGILEIQVSDSSSVEQLDYEKEARTLLVVFLCIIGVVTGFVGFFLLLKKLDKSAYEQSIAKDRRNSS